MALTALALGSLPLGMALIAYLLGGPVGDVGCKHRSHAAQDRLTPPPWTPAAAKGHICVNTDVWRTGRLTRVRFGPDAPQFLTIPETGTAAGECFARETVGTRRRN